MNSWHRRPSFLLQKQETNRFPLPGKFFVFAGNPLVSKEPNRFPKRGGVSKFFRCKAPFLLRHEIECRITPSLPAQKPWTPPLRLILRIFIWAFTDAQRRGDLL